MKNPEEIEQKTPSPSTIILYEKSDVTQSIDVFEG